MLHLRMLIGVSRFVTHYKFLCNGVEYKSDFKSYGIPVVSVSLKGTMRVGSGLIFNSGKLFNMIGRQQQCFFVVGKDATLVIGDNVGLSSTAIVCHKSIEICDNVRIGGGVVIYDTDFHSLDVSERANIPEIENARKGNVRIENGVFIGAHSIILKGVTIGQSSIIGAGSVVSKSIPPNEIWAGNPAIFIRKI